jgi:N-acetylmuramoyl-L-alanine amidase
MGFARAWRALVLATVLISGGAGVHAEAARAASPTGITAAIGLSDVRFGGDDASTRVVLDLDGAVAGDLPVDGRAAGLVVISLPPVLSSGPMEGAGRGLVKGWRVRADARGARLVLDVAPGAAAVRHFLLPPAADGGPWRYVIDIKAASSQSDPLAALVAATTGPSQPRTTVSAPRMEKAILTRPASQTPPVPGQGPYQGFGSIAEPMALPAAVGAPPASAPPHTMLVSRAVAPRSNSGRSLKVIVIDPGHGGHDTGARSLVRNEKDITLAAGLQLRARLLAMGRYKVVMTRDSDVFIPLEDRVQIARRAGADLFISLHADSAGSDPTPHGASVYTLSDHGETRVNNVLGPHEWFAGAGGKRTDPGVRQILLDLTQTSTRNRSSQFAAMLIEHIGDKVDLLPRTHRDASYFVLLAPDVPAVLLEMGFITNPADEMRLTDPAQREKLMNGVADAIDACFSGAPRLAAG